MGPVGNDLATIIPDTSAAQEAQGRKALDMNVLGEQLRGGPGHPCRTQDELVLPFPRRTIRSRHKTAELRGQVHRTDTGIVPEPGPEVEARHPAGRELRHAGVEGAGPHFHGSGEFSLERQTVVDEPAVQVEGRVVVLASTEVFDGEALAAGGAMLVPAAREKRACLAQPEAVVRVGGQVVQPARDGSTLHGSIGGAILRPSLNAHDGQVQTVVRIADGHTVGQPPEGMPYRRGAERVDGVGQTERYRHLAEAGVDGEFVEIPEQHIGMPHLKLVAIDIGIRAVPEALFRIEQHRRVTGEPVAERSGEPELRRMDRCFRHRIPTWFLAVGWRIRYPNLSSRLLV